MINIKTKVTIIFLLFNIILFLNIFRKLKEPSISTGCRSARKPPPPFTLANCKKKKFLCLSANCTKEINGSFNVTLTGFRPLDDWGQSLAAYCCEKCRDTGGQECDATCTSHSFTSLDTDQVEPFASKVKEGLDEEEHGANYHQSLMPSATNKNFDCDEGIIDPATCDCYGGLPDNDYSQPHSSGEDCGPYRFLQCYDDPSCAASFNSIRMNSFDEYEPCSNSTWGANVLNIIRNPKFRNIQPEGDGWKHFYSNESVSHGRANLNDLGTADSSAINKSYGSVLNPGSGKGWCQDICNKASDINNENGAWVDRPDLLTNPDDETSQPNTCAQSDVNWAAKFFCRSCNMYGDEEEYWAHSDPTLAPYKCNIGGGYSTDITNKYNWNYVDANGYNASDKFINEIDEDGNYKQHGTIISGDSYIPSTKWDQDRNLSHLQYYCRAACGQELVDKCYGEPSISDMDKIRNQCRAVCKKRLPCPNFLKRIAGLTSAEAEDEDGDGEPEAPEFYENAVLPCSDDASYNKIPGTCKSDSDGSVSWEELRDDIFGLGTP